MIYISQGHEKGIGLECFFKAFDCLNLEEKKLFHLFAHREHSQRLPPNLQVTSFNDSIESQTMHSLILALNLIDEKDILITLPSSKDSFVYKGTNYLGHTEFLRSYFKREELTMCFVSDHMKVALITDHIPINRVPSALTKLSIIEKIKLMMTYFHEKKYYLTGLNPHAGENGLLGTEDSIISEAVKELQKAHPDYQFVGPLPADTIFFPELKNDAINVFMYHDQGLGIFKTQNSIFGLNVTLGLPFERISVDHGTAFDLYGTGKANYFPTLYMLKAAIRRSREKYD